MYKQNNQLSLFIKTITIIVIGSLFYFNNGVDGQATRFPLTDHYYGRFDFVLNATQAIANCGGRNIYGDVGYLATITSYEEWQYIQRYFSPTQNKYWVSGSDEGDRGMWRYQTGPEKGELLYNAYTDRAYRYHLFTADEPNLMGAEYYIETVNDTYSGYHYNNLGNGPTNYFICEWGGLERPYLTQVETTGGVATVRFPVGSTYTYSNMTILFTSVDNPAVTFQCANFTVINATISTCVVPPGQGRYQVTFLSSPPALPHPLYWMYSPAYVTFAKPSLVAGGAVTIVGGSFGTDPSLVTIYSGNNKTRTCGSVQFIQGSYLNETVLTCILSGAVPTSATWDKFLPLTFNISGVISSQHKVPLYDTGTNQYYLTWKAMVSWTYARDTVAPKMIADGYEGRMSYIETQAMYNFLNRSMAPISPDASNSLNIWQGVRFSEIANLYTIVQGPRAGTNITLYATQVPTGLQNRQTPYFVQLTDDTLRNPLQVYWSNQEQGVFYEYGGISPVFIATQTFTSPTSGMLVKIKLNVYGAYFSTVTVNLKGIPIAFNRTNVRGEIDVAIPAGSGGPHSLSVTIDGMTTPANTQFVQYIAPAITGMSPLPSTNGSLITVTGTNLFNNPALILACSAIDVSSPHTQLVCLLPPQQGNYSLVVTVSYISSEPYAFAYDSVTVSSITQIADYLEIVGTNFGNNLAFLGVAIGAVSIKSSCLGNNTYVLCNPVPQSTVSGDLVFTGSAIAPPPVPFYFTPVLTSLSTVLFPTAGGLVVVHGRYFEPTVYGSVDNSLVVIDNNIVNTNIGYQSLTTLNYHILAGTGINRQLLVQAGGSRNSTVFLYSFQPPTVTSYSMDPVTDTITAVGTNFGADNTTITFQMAGLKARNVVIQTPHTTASFVIQNQSLSGDLLVNVDGQTVTFNNLNLTPLITYTTLPSVDGGVFLVYGKYLSQIDQSGTNTGISFSVSASTTTTAVPCTFIAIVNGLYSYQCTIGSGSGQFTTKASVRGVDSAPYGMSYQYPAITSVSSITYREPGEITLFGTNFAATGLLVTIGNSSTQTSICTAPQVIGSTIITCHYDASLIATGPLPVKVVVNGLEGSKDDAFVYTNIQVSGVTQINDGLVIQGLNFGNVSNLQLFIGTVEITSFTGNNTVITCNTLPLAVSSGVLSIDNGLVKVEFQPIYFTPYLVSLSDVVLETVGQNVTIQGRFFETESMGQNNTVYVINNGEPPVQGPTIQVIDSQTIIYSVPGATGTGLAIAIKIESRVSNELIYSFVAPTLDSLQQQQYTLFVFGQSFGQLSQNIQVLFGSLTITPTSVNDTTLEINLPIESVNANLSISVSGQISTNTLTVSLVPIISQVSPLALTTGTNITITGDYLSPVDNASSDIQMSFSATLLGSGVDNILSCYYLSSVAPYSVVCAMIQGYGYYDLTAYYSATYSDPLHTSYAPPVIVTSTSLFFNKPGNITISGDSFSSNNLQVFVGTNDVNATCTNATLLDFETIECYYSADIRQVGSDIHFPLNITVGCGGLVGQNNVFLYYENYKCPGTPAACSGKGQCQETTGYCTCNTGFSGWDCSIEVNHQTPPTLPPYTNSSDGSGKLPTGYSPLEYQVRIAYLREITSLSNGSATVHTLAMTNITWLLPTVITTNTTLFSGYWNDTTVGNVQLSFNVTHIEQPRNVSFAGVSMPADANSIKYTVKVDNWVFSDSLNRLEILFATTTSATTVYNCSQSKTSFSSNALDTSSGGGLQTSYFTNLVINTGPAVLNIRFADRLILDNDIIKSNTAVLLANDTLYQLYNQEQNINTTETYTLLSSIITPSFSHNVIVDPLFSTVSRANYNQTCYVPPSSSDSRGGNTGGGNDEPGWKLPVIIACSVAGGILALAIAAVIIKKNAFKNNDSIKLKGWSANKAYSGPNGGTAAGQ
ncbi:EGF-like domain-containing protein [Cavenderia fasciculata]|uniref:EGF-like domain-containing protein n=1 Tax=Cavenderia fasciculata TaxID=261658 RepID=F4QC46_CACFS|nr:EGF-like domain-containing protein [Cavenderia fasciculata]EGG13533.1 EGF-like domain-containing protein [Cavenderia fasciculata]|eukprot:XP_004350237.1 EGF-like domain-containing protein [Cavenderia fasciculata]